MKKNSKTPLYPGKHTALDGCEAVATIEMMQSSAAITYPITPSTPMGVIYQKGVANGYQNVWGETLVFLEPESEHSSASACEGYALAGGRVTNFTSGQGLILMKEVLFTLSGKHLPVVFHIGARALSSQALTIHAGHDDVMGVSDCGWGMLFARNPQEAADFALISRKTAEDSYIPFFNIQDGFLTTHTVESLSLPEPELVKAYLKPPEEVLNNFLDPDNPVMSGTVQSQDAYMRSKVAQRAFYKKLKPNLIANMKRFYELTGREYDLIDSCQMVDAEYAIVGMGSFMGTVETTVDLLREKENEKVGLVTLHSYRPFPGPRLVNALKHVKVISVLERIDDPNSPDNPLTLELKAAFSSALAGDPDYPKIDSIPLIQSGSGGLGSNDVRVADVQAIVKNMKLAEKGNFHYCLGIDHPDALKRVEPELTTLYKDYFALRGNSIGGYGSISTNKIIASVAADLFDLTVQAAPKYGAEKKGLPTSFFLALSHNPIKTHQELTYVDMIAIQDPNAFHHGNPLEGIADEGILFVRSPERDPKLAWKSIPKSAQEIILQKNLKLYVLDTVRISHEVARTPSMATQMRGIVLLGVFLKTTPFLKQYKISEATCFKKVKTSLENYFKKLKPETIEDNLNCVKRGFKEVIKIERPR